VCGFVISLVFLNFCFDEHRWPPGQACRLTPRANHLCHEQLGWGPSPACRTESFTPPWHAAPPRRVTAPSYGRCHKRTTLLLERATSLASRRTEGHLEATSRINLTHHRGSPLRRAAPATSRANRCIPEDPASTSSLSSQSHPSAQDLPPRAA
jgi:hypothetical protein